MTEKEGKLGFAWMQQRSNARIKGGLRHDGDWVQGGLLVKSARRQDMKEGGTQDAQWSRSAVDGLHQKNSQEG